MIVRSELRWRKPRTSWLLWHAVVLSAILSFHCCTGAQENVSARLPVQFELDDAITIEVGKSTQDVSISPENVRNKRQVFQGFGQNLFPPGWPFVTNRPGSISPQQPQYPQFPSFPQFPGIQNLQPQPTHPPTPAAPTHPPQITGPCLTNNGLTGYCASFRQCYPILYSPDDGHIMNNGLAEMYRNISGPCNGHETPNFFMFRADAQLRQNQICCSSPVATHPGFPSLGFPPLYPFPQITMRPPSAYPPFFSTTTTTTQRPPQTTQWWQTTTTTTPRPPQTTTQWWQTTTTTTPRPPQTTTQWWQTTTTTTPRPPQTTSRWWPQPTPQSTTTTEIPVVQSSCGIGKIVGGSQVCGGSLIDNQFILTAAHCFNGVTGQELQSLFKVYIGDYDLHSLSDGPMTVKSISKLIVHRSFHQQFFYNDIALLKLDSPVQFGNNGNNNIRPICLSQGGNYEGQSAVVAGWGRTAAQVPSSQPGIYRKVELKVWNLQQCAATYGGSAPGGITSQMMCAGVTNKDSCLGDSGGPLMRLVGNVWEQIGIVSWGIGCGTYPGVYTRVADYQDWISRQRQS